MKLRLSASLFLFALTTHSFASPAYMGVFGGGSSSSSLNASQFGTAFFTEAEGGPLAVDAFGRLNGSSRSLFGAQLGYQTHGMIFGSSSQFRFAPAAELEMYSMNNSSFNGILRNNTDRLVEHNFQVSYPMKRNVFLANAILNFTNKHYPVHPYIGLGIGDAIVRISGANSRQVDPLELDINHYNSNSSDNTSAFAGQIKIGLIIDLCKSFSLFADYRWLYLASTQFTFGSTVYPIHAPTSSWQVKLGAQKDRVADVGLRFNF